MSAKQALQISRWLDAVDRKIERQMQPDRMRPTHYVTIDEPGMGYCHSAYGVDDANRHAAMLRAKGYRVKITLATP